MNWLKDILFWLSELAIPGIFVYAAMHKLMSPTEFQVKLLKAGYIPDMWIPSLSYMVPYVELIAVIMCLRRTTEGMGWLILYGLLILFTGHLVILHIIAPSAPCSCGGLLDRIPLGHHLVLNAALILLAIYRMRKRGYEL